MRLGAERIARLFDVRWVVMGHTHDPVIEQMDTGATYVNLGSWGQDDTPDERSLAEACTQTFLTLRRLGDDYRAELLRWDPARGVVQAVQRLSQAPR
jgi:predicted phosphodiesterase